MGLISSTRRESLGRSFRTLTQDELTMMIYTICKNIVAKWCYPTRYPNTVSRKEINNFLDMTDFHSKKVKVNFSDIKKSYEVPYDVYLRGLYRFSEGRENRIGSNMDKVLFEKVIGELYSVDSSCINHLHVDLSNNTFTYANIVTNLRDQNTEAFSRAILSSYIKCNYGAITVNSTTSDVGHRTLLYIENNNNNLNIFYYDPHGYGEHSWSTRMNIYNILFNMFNSIIRRYSLDYNIMSININKYETICLRGIQFHSGKYDVGMCQIFSSLWLYTVIKIIAEANKNGINLPSTDKWLYLVDDYYISQFNDKQRYNVLLIFIFKLFNYYTRTNKNYREELYSYSNYLVSTNQISEYEVQYSERSVEEMEEEKQYSEFLDKLAKKKVIKARRKKSKSRINIDEDETESEGEDEGEEKKGGFIARSLLPSSLKKIRKQKSRINIDEDETESEGEDEGEEKKRGFIAESLLPSPLKRKIEKVEKKQEEEEETYEQFEKKVKLQRQKERFTKFLPFGANKQLFEECKENNECLSGCCHTNDIDKKNYCNVPSVCAEK
jgi:hypothetical protein